jgi:dolichol-phosphate mannosyltransferase
VNVVDAALGIRDVLPAGEGPFVRAGLAHLSASNGGEPTPFKPIVSIVLATLNERFGLPSLVDGLRSLPLPTYEILVVDDGSTDGTRELIAETARQDGRVRGLFHDGRRTLRQAQLEGVESAMGDYVVLMDADLQHPAAEVMRIVQELDAGADLVVASRYAPGGTAGRRPPIRAVVSRAAEVLAKACLPEARRVGDPLSGFFGFRREKFEPPKVRKGGYKLLLSLLVACKGHRIVELPYAFRERTDGESKILGSVRFVPIFLSELLSARRLRDS